MEKYVPSTQGQVGRGPGGKGLRASWRAGSSLEPRTASFAGKEKQFSSKMEKPSEHKESRSDRGHTRSFCFCFCFFCWAGVHFFFFFLDIKNRDTRQESHQGSPRHHLLNWSKRGISPNANEQRTIHVTQNIRYALMRQGVRQGGDL